MSIAMDNGSKRFKIQDYKKSIFNFMIQLNQNFRYAVMQNMSNDLCLQKIRNNSLIFHLKLVGTKYTNCIFNFVAC